MDRLTFITKLVEALAWPVTILLAIILLRKQIVDLLPRLRQLRYRDWAADFEQRLEAADRAADAAQLPEPKPEQDSGGQSRTTFGVLNEMLVVMQPSAAIDAAWKRLLRAMEAALKREEIAAPLSEETINRELIARGLLPPNAMVLIDTLRDLRNRAVRSGDFGIEAGQALDFVRLVDRLVAALEAPALPKS